MRFLYFGYGSNMDALALAAKGVRPAWSRRAQLPDWRLAFNVAHFFAHEGGMGNVLPSPGDTVHGVLHAVDDAAALALLDQAELHPHGYARRLLPVHSSEGICDAWVYIGTPAFSDDSRRPTARYLNILLQGARAAGLPDDYLAHLHAWPRHENAPAPPFLPPPGDWPRWSAAALAAAPRHTALDGHVWDMGEARWQHRLLWDWFGGRDMTLFHLRRLDSADGSEDERLVATRAYKAAQREHLDRYLQAYGAEYRYAGPLTQSDTSINPQLHRTEVI